MRARTALGIAFVGGIALVAGLDQRVRDAAKDLFKPPRIEEPAKGNSGDITLKERLTQENFADNTSYVSLDLFNGTGFRYRNEDSYTAGQTERFKLYIGATSSQVRAFVLYEDNIAIRVWNEIIPPYGNLSKYVEIKREKGLHTYELRAWDNIGKMVKSRPIRIDYSGEFTDLPPRIETFQDYDIGGGEDFAALSFRVRDYGDNPGIDSVIVYQDGRQIRVLKDVVESYIGSNEVVIRGLKHGQYKFNFKAIDKGGNEFVSEPVEFYSRPNPQPPKIPKIERIK